MEGLRISSTAATLKPLDENALGFYGRLRLGSLINWIPW
jgi:hypothetical protein